MYTEKASATCFHDLVRHMPPLRKGDSSMHLEETVRIHQLVATVFKYVTNLTHWPQYRGAIQATSVPATPLDTGVTFQTKTKFLGRAYDQTHEVTTYEPNRRFSHHS